MKALQGEALLLALESGEVRAAEPCVDSPGGWRVNAWVKEGILEIFRSSQVVPMDHHGKQTSDGPFRDKDAFPLQSFGSDSEVRMVPGGSAVRRGAHLAAGVVCMPPMYVNVGAFVGPGTMVDSHALVGSCAQIGRSVHLSAAAQIGGVLEPVGAQPVVIEDGAFIGGGVGVYEGVLIGARSVLAAGVVLTASTPVFDLVREKEYRGSSDEPLRIPTGAVVVPGTRTASGGFAERHGLALNCALIVKYRDERTDAGVALEEALRSPQG